jgi:hypothetical protein
MERFFLHVELCNYSHYLHIIFNSTFHGKVNKAFVVVFVNFYMKELMEQESIPTEYESYFSSQYRHAWTRDDAQSDQHDWMNCSRRAVIGARSGRTDSVLPIF